MIWWHKGFMTFIVTDRMKHNKQEQQKHRIICVLWSPQFCLKEDNVGTSVKLLSVMLEVQKLRFSVQKRIKAQRFCSVFYLLLSGEIKSTTGLPSGEKERISLFILLKFHQPIFSLGEFSLLLWKFKVASVLSFGSIGVFVFVPSVILDVNLYYIILSLYYKDFIRIIK